MRLTFLILLTFAMRSRRTPVLPEIPKRVSPGLTIQVDTQPLAPLGGAGVDVGAGVLGSTPGLSGVVGCADGSCPAVAVGLLLAEGVALPVLPGDVVAEEEGEAEEDGLSVPDGEEITEGEAEGEGEPEPVGAGVAVIVTAGFGARL